MSDDAFAPLSVDETAESTADISITADAEPVVITPVPDHADDPNRAATRAYGRRPDRLDTYRDHEGRMLFHVCRWDEVGGGKTIRPLSWVRRGDGREDWAFRHHPVPRPLLGLDKLAARPDAPVVVAEGEKASEAAAKVFPLSVVVTWPAGSNAVAKTDWSPLTDRSRVLVWPDADEPGAKATMAIVEALSEYEGIEITIVDAEALAALSPADGGRRAVKVGWDAADAVTEWADLDALRHAVVRHSRPVEIGPRYRSFGKFEMNGDGLHATVVKGKGKNAVEEEIRVSGAFEVVGRVRDPDGNGWAKLLRWKDEDRRTRTHSVADADLQGDPRAMCSTLADMGLAITRGYGGHLANYLNTVRVDRRVTTVPRTGWHNIACSSCFVLPDRTFGAPAGETVILSGASTAPFGLEGSLDDWKNGIGRLVSGQTRHVFMVSAAFVGPLLTHAKQEGGGVHLFGSSSTGKSTAIEAAASVWGRGATPGYVRSWRATANALEAAAALHTHTALVLDELGVVEAREAGAAAYQLSAGSGKGRSARDGSLRAPMTWQTFYLSTGEIRLADKLVEGKQRASAGQAVRLLDIPADAGKGFGSFDHGGETGNAKDLSDAIKQAARTHYGTAGPAFISHIIAEGVDDVAGIVLDMVAAFRSKVIPEGADGQVLRAADRFGLVAVAGELAISFGVVPWAPGEAAAAAEACFRDWLAARGGSDAHEVREAIERVRGFIEAHGDSRFESLDFPDKTRPIQNRAGYRRGDGPEKEWLISPQAWRTEVIAGLDPTAAARALSDRGMLKRAKDGFSRPEKVDGRTQRFYVVTASVLTEAHYV